MADERIGLVLDLEHSNADVTELRDNLKGLGDDVGKAGESVDRAEKSTVNLGRAALDSGRALQDFAQGGIGGVLNNIEGLTMSLGGGPGLAGVLTAVGLAAYFALPRMKELWASLVDGQNEVPKASDLLSRLGEELKTAGERLKELRDQQTLTNTELAEYNTLAAKTVELEKAKNAEAANRATLEAQRRKEGAGNPESADVASAATTEAGGVDKVVNDLAKLTAEGSDALKKAVADFNATADAIAAERQSHTLSAAEENYFDSMLRSKRDTVTNTFEGIRSEAGGTVAGALKGDQDAIKRLAAAFPNSSFGQATTESIRQQNAEVDAVDAQGQRLHDARARKRADDASVDALNRQGQQNEGAMAKAQQDAQAADAAALAKVLEKALDAATKAVDANQAALDDPKAEARRASIREQSELGREFRERAADEGANVGVDQGVQAAKHVQDLMKRGLSKDEAMIDVFRQMLIDQARIGQMQARQEAQWRQLAQFQQRNVGWQAGPR